jgi:hypothetical protein
MSRGLILDDATARRVVALAATIALWFAVWALLLCAAWASSWPFSRPPEPAERETVVGIRVAEFSGPGQAHLSPPRGAPSPRCEDDSAPAPGPIHALVEPDGRTVSLVQDLVCA